MRHAMVAAIALVVVAGLGMPGCSEQDVPPLLSSAHAGNPMAPLYPPLPADAVDDSAYEYY
jgi:hypothetical protein